MLRPTKVCLLLLLHSISAVMQLKMMSVQQVIPMRLTSRIDFLTSVMMALITLMLSLLSRVIPGPIVRVMIYRVATQLTSPY